MPEFKAIQWNPNDPMDRAKLNQMSENDQYLFDNTANMAYKDVSGIRTVTGLKLIGGIAMLGPASTQSSPVNVNYAGEFNSGITPIITTGLVVTNTSDHHSLLTIKGIGQMLPSDTGFQFRWEKRATSKASQVRKGTVYCNYMAMGVSSKTTAAPEQ